MKKRALAFDFGASSGRAILVETNGKMLKLEEIHRFDNEPVLLGSTLYWDFLRLFHEVKRGMEKAQAAGGFDCVSVDTWGVDFGLIDKSGHLLENPVHYRDGRTAGMVEAVCARIPHEALYRQTGTQIMEINTLFQLEALRQTRPELLAQADTLLFMPALFTYFLTGVMQADPSIASTSQLLTPGKRLWNDSLLKLLGLPSAILPRLVPSGTVAGPLKQELCKELSLPPVPVVTGTGHDTACAVAAVPTEEEDFIFISCGTWSLFGTVLDAPILTEKSQRHNLTNEIGYGGSTRFLKNIIGLWLIQETRRQFCREGKPYSYAEMEQLAKQCSPFSCLIDPDAPEFVPQGDIPGRIRAFCARTGQPVPESDGAVIRCIYESIAMKYRLALEEIKDCTGRQYGTIYMLGGGTKDAFLCQLTADMTGCVVTVGPLEATALGNAIVQLLSLGVFPDLRTARRAVRLSCSPRLFIPNSTKQLESVYPRFLSLITK